MDADELGLAHLTANAGRLRSPSAGSVTRVSPLGSDRHLSTSASVLQDSSRSHAVSSGKAADIRRRDSESVLAERIALQEERMAMQERIHRYQLALVAIVAVVAAVLGQRLAML